MSPDQAAPLRARVSRGARHAITIVGGLLTAWATWFSAAFWTASASWPQAGVAILVGVVGGVIARGSAEERPLVLGAHVAAIAFAGAMAAFVVDACLAVASEDFGVVFVLFVGALYASIRNLIVAAVIGGVMALVGAVLAARAPPPASAPPGSDEPP